MFFFAFILVYWMMKIAIQWIKWAFHEIAAKQYFSNESDIEIVEKDDFEGLLDSVVAGESDYWIIAIENTIVGTIYHNLNLIKDKKVAIIWEVYIRIQQNLAALPWVKIEDIKEVHSHYMAIDQTRKFFEEYPHIKLVEIPDTALAFREIQETQRKDLWAIGWKLAAEVYGLDIVAEWIETNKQNYTRFFIVQKDSKFSNTVYNKASLHILLPHQVGSLVQILSVMAAYGINLTKIESLPILWEPFHYRFYVDVIFSDIQRYHDMLSAIRPLLKQLDVLWEYLAYDESLENN